MALPVCHGSICLAGLDPPCPCLLRTSFTQGVFCFLCMRGKKKKRFTPSHNFCAFQSIVIQHHVWGFGRDRERKEWGNEGKRMGKSKEERHRPSNVFLKGIPSVVQCFFPTTRYSFWVLLSFNKPPPTPPNQTDNQ